MDEVHGNSAARPNPGTSSNTSTCNTDTDSNTNNRPTTDAIRKSRSCYNKHFTVEEDDPSKVAPRTSRWRSQRKKRKAEELLILSPDTDYNDDNSNVTATSIAASASIHELESKQIYQPACDNSRNRISNDMNDEGQGHDVVLKKFASMPSASPVMQQSTPTSGDFPSQNRNLMNLETSDLIESGSDRTAQIHRHDSSQSELEPCSFGIHRTEPIAADITLQTCSSDTIGGNDVNNLVFELHGNETSNNDFVMNSGQDARLVTDFPNDGNGITYVGPCNEKDVTMSDSQDLNTNCTAACDCETGSAPSAISLWEEDGSGDIDDERSNGVEGERVDCDKELYAGSRLTVADSMLLILNHALRHDLNGVELSDLLGLIELHCPHENLCKTSLYKFRSYFSDIKMPMVYHKYCAKCNFYLGVDEVETCPNDLCKCDILKRKPSVFIEIPIANQIESFFNRKHFHEELLHRFSRRKVSAENIEDIYDGTLYKDLSQPGGFLSNKNNISLTWYTDGVQVFKSTKSSLWPVFFVVNELPYVERMHPDNMIYAGLWYGEGKPKMSTYLKPICKSLNVLHKEGINLNCSHCKDINVKVTLISGTCDLPAKACVMNMTHFNGKYGCPNCTQPGEVVPAGRGTARVFPFDYEHVNGPLREHNETITFAIEAVAGGSSVQGINGPSWFTSVHNYDLIQGTAIDYMHGVLLGPVRRLLHLWFDSSYSSEAFSIRDKLSEVDQKLQDLKPPSFITRLPRSISAHKGHWKANECRSWLFFYSVPLLLDILPDNYYQHHLLLVEVVHILNRVSISPSDLIHCEKVMIHYCTMYEALYKKRHMSMNIHQMLHLVDMVRHLGPLWTHSTFGYESVNGKLVKFIHGAKNPMKQIANSISTMLHLPALGSKLMEGNSKACKFYQRQRRGAYNLSTGEKISKGIFVVGSFKPLDKTYSSVLLGDQMLGSYQVSSFRRAKVNSVLICGREYGALNSRLSHVVAIHGSGDRAIVECFVKVHCECLPRFYALVRMLEEVPGGNKNFCSDDLTHTVLSHIKLVFTEPGELLCVPMSEISDVCSFVNVEAFPGQALAILAPNHLEGD